MSVDKVQFSIKPEEDSSECSSLNPRKAKKSPQIFAGIIATLGHCCIGSTAAYTAMAVPSLQSPQSPIPLTDLQASWIGSLFPFGAMVTTIIAGPLMHRFGRKSVLLVAAVPYIISWILIATAQTVHSIYFGRILAGTASGLIMPTAQVYIAEISQAKIRGAISPLTQIMWTLGVLLSYCIGSFCEWRMLAWISSIFPVLFVASMALMPKSPTWLISKKKYDEAKATMEWLRGTQFDASMELANIRKNLEETKHDIGHPKDLFQWKYLRPFLVCTGLMIFQRASGAVNFVYYSASLFIAAGGSVDARLSAIIFASTMLLGTIISTFLLDKIGRRRALQISAFFMTLSLVTIGTYFYLKDHPQYQDIMRYLGLLPIFTMVIFMFSFSVGFNPVPFVMVGELLPARIRGSGAGIILWINMLVTSAWLQAYFPLIHVIHQYGTFWLYACLSFLGFIFAIIWVPETKRQTLEDIERKLSKRELNQEEQNDLIPGKSKANTLLKQDSVNETSK